MKPGKIPTISTTVVATTLWWIQGVSRFPWKPPFECFWSSGLQLKLGYSVFVNLS